jgi:hypothetical protein
VAGRLGLTFHDGSDGMGTRRYAPPLGGLIAIVGEKFR